MTIKEQPLVSIGLLSYNHERYLQECLSSLIGQTYKNIELIIIDDCSMDNTRKIFRSNMKKLKNRFKRVLYIENKYNTGMEQLTVNCNKLVRFSKGKYIKLFGTDDIMVDSLVEDSVKLLEYHTEYAMSYGKVVIVDDKFKIGDSLEKNRISPQMTDVRSGFGLYPKFLWHMSINAQTAMFRKDIYDKYGGFDENIQIEDVDFWLRVSQTEGIGFINKVLTYYREAETSISNYKTGDRRKKYRFGLRNVTKMYKKHLKNIDKKTAMRIIVSHYLHFFIKAINCDLALEAKYFYHRLEKLNVELTREQSMQWKMYQMHMLKPYQLLQKVVYNFK